MTIYIPLLYICIALECKFFQSEIYTLDEQKCLQEITQQKSELVKQNKTVEAICIDINIKLERKNDATDSQLQLT
jgi:hypothetical protein